WQPALGFRPGSPPSTHSSIGGQLSGTCPTSTRNLKGGQADTVYTESVRPPQGESEDSLPCGRTRCPEEGGQLSADLSICTIAKSRATSRRLADNWRTSARSSLGRPGRIRDRVG